MIGTYDYVITAEAISEAYDLGQQSLAPLICMFNKLQSSDVNPKQRQKTELESYIRTTYAYIILNHLTNQQTLLNTVKSLNAHVLKYYGEIYGYENLDDFLSGQYLSVPITYASLSRQVGYPITVVGEYGFTFADIIALWGDIDIPFNSIGSSTGDSPEIRDARARFDDIHVFWSNVNVPFNRLGWRNV